MRNHPAPVLWLVALLLAIFVGPPIFTLWQGYVVAPLEVNVLSIVAPETKETTAAILIVSNITGAAMFAAPLGFVIGNVVASRPAFQGMLFGGVIAISTIAITFGPTPNSVGISEAITLAEHLTLILGCMLFAHAFYRTRRKRAA